MKSQVSRNLPEQIEETLQKPVTKIYESTLICIYNFEASNVAADSISSFVYKNTKIQIHTIVDKSVPEWITPSADVIIMSYRGVNRYIESIYSKVKSRGSKIHCITSGGKLREICEKNSDDLYLIPENLTPFEATGYEMGALVNLYESIGATSIKDAMISILPRLKEYRDLIWDSEYAWKLAMRVNGAIPVIYCSGELRAVHKRWKMLLNSIVNKLAFSGEFPEFDHNEIVSWTEDKDSREFIMLIIKSESESELLDKIFDSAIKVLSKYKLDIEVIDIDGTIMERSIKGIILADAVINRLSEVNT